MKRIFVLDYEMCQKKLEGGIYEASQVMIFILIISLFFINKQRGSEN